MSQPEIWKDYKKTHLERGLPSATEIKISKLQELKEKTEKFENLKKEIYDLLEEKIVGEEKLNLLKKELKELELFLLFREKYDLNNALLTIHAGAGGTEAQDWANMLKRMYLRFAEKKGWKGGIIDESLGKEAGIKSATLEIKGRYAYGFLKNEAGVHRLVRISPFDASKLRHTSFALVEVLPELEEEKIPEIETKELKIETYIASKPGGQKMQKTETAVRIIHLPTGIKISCQKERSQKQNKEVALKILNFKLKNYYLAEREEERRKIKGEFRSAEWGNQIRSYVLHPYKLVKDHRTEYETSEVERILDGELDDFIEFLLKRT